MKKTLLLTGATGFLGSNLLRALSERGHRIVALRRRQSSMLRVKDVTGDISWINLEESSLEEVFHEESRVDAIIHCATDYGRKTVNPIQTLDANLILPLKLLEYARQFDVPLFINSDTILDKGVNDYALSKKQFVEWLQTYSDKLSCVNVALEHFFGPADDSSKFVSSIIRLFLQNATRIALTPGEQRRDFVFVDDVISAFLILIDKAPSLGLGFHRFEVGSGRSMRIRDFVELMKKISGNQVTWLGFGDLPYRKSEVMESTTNIDGLSALGWCPRVPLEEGLARTIAYERHHFPCAI